MLQALAAAIESHLRGDIDRAELICRQILDETPDHPEALNLLGVAAIQRGQPGRAVALLSRAVELAPNEGTYHGNLAEAYRVGGDAGRSAEAARRAVALAPHIADEHNHLGLALQMLGRLDEAEAAFREAIELRPGFALAHNNLGGVYRDLGRNDEALACYRRAVELAPDFPLALSNLGHALLEKGEKDEAERYCRRAVELAPGFPEGLSNLGNVLRAKDNLREAKESYRAALRLRPDVAVIHGNLGEALQQEGNLAEAIKCYERAVALDPRSPRFESYLAGALAEKEDFAGAAEHYRRALALKPDSPEALNGLGSVLLERGDFAGAVAAFEEALRVKPDFADAHSSLGGAYSELGDMDRAVRHYREAIRHDPEYVGAYGVLVTHLRDRMPDEDVRAMCDFLAREHLTDWKRATLHHGLAHYHDARGEYARAADHAAKGNAFRREVWNRQGKGYARDEHTAFVSVLIKQFGPSFFERVRGWGLDTEVPVFVVGLPRSGTTLLEQILASHPRVFGAGEQPVAKETLDRLPEWMSKHAAPVLCAAEMDREIVRRAGGEHLSRLRALHPTADRVVDKMPDNYLWLGFIAAVFPRAKIIYSKRGLHDVAVSCWMTNFKAIRWACDQEDIANRIRNHVRVMEHWRRVLPVPVLEVEYEQMVEDLEGVARKMIDFVGLEWDPACLAFHESKRTVRTASLSQVRQPVYRRSVRRWRNYAEPLKTLFDLIES